MTIARGPHRADCGCNYCLPPVQIRDLTAEAHSRAVVEHDLQDILRQAEDQFPEMRDWHGGREITQGTNGSIIGCTHRHYTKYPGPWYFCRDCGRKMTTEPFRP